MGCGISKTAVANNVKEPVMHMPLPKAPSPPPTPPLPADPPKPTRLLPQVENVENSVVVWLNESTGSNEERQDAEHQLHQHVNAVKIFSNVEECHTFIQNIKNQKIFLIVSDTHAKQFVHIIQQLTQIDSVYVFSSNNQTHEDWSQNFPEIHGQYTSLTSLASQLDEDIKKSDHNLLGFEVVAPSSSTTMTRANKQEATFMYDQLFWEIILDIKDDDRTDMFEFYKLKYQESGIEMVFLTKLEEDYLNKSPIYWYSTDSCLHKALNYALRNHEYQTLYIMRVFIRHLHQQIVDEHENAKFTVLTLYRGQQMEKKQFDRIRENEEGLLSFSNFLSTTTNLKIALNFAGKPIQDSTIVHILFEIIVDKKTSTHFADIHEISAIPVEDEWLFTMGSVFRIGLITCRSDGIWRITLKLTNDNDEQLDVLKKYFQKSTQDKNPCFRIAKIMYHLASWKDAAYFYELALQTETHWYRRAVILNDLGLVKTELEEYEKALGHFQESLALKQEHGGSDNKNIASSYNNIGILYYKQKKMDLAKENFEKSLEFYNKTASNDQALIATIHHNIGTILNHQEKHEEALQNNQKCLNIQLEIFPSNHPHVAATYGSIATTYHYLRAFSEAVEYAQKATDIDRQTLPPEHPQTKFHEQNLQVFKQQLESSKSNV